MLRVTCYVKIIIGLGNPGKKYNNTRHNVGFMAIDKLQEKWGFPDFEFNKKFEAELSVGNKNFYSLPEENKIILAKPQTFMNLSGQTVKAILDFYKLTPKDIIIIHDDLDLILGKYKIALDSSAAGHNGVQDIIDTLGTKEFHRIRIGIANEDLRTKIDSKNFVLQKFKDEETKTIKKVLNETTKNIIP